MKLWMIPLIAILSACSSSPPYEFRTMEGARCKQQCSEASNRCRNNPFYCDAARGRCVGACKDVDRLSADAGGAAANLNVETAREVARIKAEIQYTRARHPQFDIYRQATLRYVWTYPKLLIEEAYCAVSREPSDLCEEVLKTIPTEAPSAIPPQAIQIFLKQNDGVFIPLLDEQTGAPIFEADGIEYTAFGRVGQAKVKPQSFPAAGILSGPLLGPINTDAYGPGLHSDATGRSFTYRTRDGQQTNGPVQQDGYGLGVHMDQFGRPVYAVPQR